MSNPNLSAIVVVLDRSGSMESIRDDTTGGLNAFIGEQQKLPQECLLTIAQFDDQYEVMMQNLPIQNYRPLDRNTFVPRGGTALLDAIGRTINTTEEQFNALPETRRPGKIFLVISTDGGENSSREFNRDKIFAMIKAQRAKGWEVIFLGSNQDAIQVGATYGCSAASSLSFNSTSMGTSNVYDALSKKIRSVRSNEKKSVEFDEDDRSGSMAP